MCGILLTYMCYQLSSRPHYSVFWEAGCDKSYDIPTYVKDIFFLPLLNSPLKPTKGNHIRDNDKYLCQHRIAGVIEIDNSIFDPSPTWILDLDPQNHIQWFIIHDINYRNRFDYVIKSTYGYSQTQTDWSSLNLHKK